MFFCMVIIKQKTSYNGTSYRLIGTTLCGMVPAMLEVVRRIPNLEQIVALGQRRWLWMAMFFLAIFVLLNSWPIMFGRLTLHVYF